MPKRWRWIFVGLTAVLLTCAATFISKSPLDIGESPRVIYFRDMDSIGNEPFIDKKVFGRRFVLPDPLPALKASDFDPDSAGVIYVDYGERVGRRSPIQWRLDGKQFEVAPTMIDSGKHPRWAISAVPYAPSPTNRDAEILVDADRWVSIKLPYKSGREPVAMRPITITVGSLTIKAVPRPRIVSATDATYDLSVEGTSNEVLAVGTLTYDDPMGFIVPIVRPWGTGFKSENSVQVPRLGTTTIVGKLYVVERVPITVHVFPGYAQLTVMETSDGEILVDEDNFYFGRIGCVALEYRGMLYYHFLQRGQSILNADPETKAVGFRSLKTYKFKLVLTNSAP